MTTTLTELADRHGFPFIARHVPSDKRYLVLRYSGVSEALFKVVEVPELQDVPFDDTPMTEVYGGYEYYGGYGMWSFEKEVDKKANISPEEQKKIRDEQRRKDNEMTKRMYRLKEGDSVRSATRKAPPKKKTVRVATDDNVIEVDFTKKK